MTQLVEHRIEVAGHATRALEVPGSAPGIVLLHGWSDSADTWRPLLAELARRGRRAIAVDLPAAWSLDDGAVLPQLDAFAADLVATWAGDDPVVVAGTSLGGCLALRLAEHPGDVRLAGVVPVAPDGLERAAWFDPIERDPIVRKLLSIPIPVPGVLARRATYRDADPGAAQRALVAALGRDADLAPLLATAPFDLVGIRCPVLLVWGAHDRAVPRTNARIALDALPTTHVELIADAGPRPQLDAAGRLAELLLPLGT